MRSYAPRRTDGPRETLRTAHATMLSTYSQAWYRGDDKTCLALAPYLQTVGLLPRKTLNFSAAGGTAPSPAEKKALLLRDYTIAYNAKNYARCRALTPAMQAAGLLAKTPAPSAFSAGSAAKGAAPDRGAVLAHKKKTLSPEEWKKLTKTFSDDDWAAYTDYYSKRK